MYAAWGPGYSDMYEENDEDIVLMAIKNQMLNFNQTSKNLR